MYKLELAFAAERFGKAEHARQHALGLRGLGLQERPLGSRLGRPQPAD